jgi:hypothetical protein
MKLMLMDYHLTSSQVVRRRAIGDKLIPMDNDHNVDHLSQVALLLTKQLKGET